MSEEIAGPVHTRFVSVDELFSKTAESGATVIGHSDAKASYSLADIESQFATEHNRAVSPDEMEVEKWCSMPVSQLFAAAAVGEDLVAS